MAGIEILELPPEAFSATLWKPEKRLRRLHNRPAIDSKLHSTQIETEFLLSLDL